LISFGIKTKIDHRNRRLAAPKRKEVGVTLEACRMTLAPRSPWGIFAAGGFAMVQWIVGLLCSAIWGGLLASILTPIYRKSFLTHAVVVNWGFKWHLLACQVTYLCVYVGHLLLFSLVESSSHLTIFNSSGFYLWSVLTTGVIFSGIFTPSIIRWEKIISDTVNDPEIMKTIISEVKENSDREKAKRSKT
jgi:hypothetical protein